MMLVARKTDYAIRTLVFLASTDKKLVTCSELAKRLRIPYSFLRSILQALNRQKLLVSSKGKTGGFKLVKSPEKIFLLDLIKLFQGPIILNKCKFKGRQCHNVRSCVFRKKITGIEEYIKSELQFVTLKSLVRYPVKRVSA